VSYDEDNGSTNFEAYFHFPNNNTILLKVFLDEIRINTKTNNAVKNPITYVPNSKYQIPKNDKNTKPITVYNCSNITIGTVLLLGIPKFEANRQHF